MKGSQSAVANSLNDRLRLADPTHAPDAALRHGLNGVRPKCDQARSSGMANRGVDDAVMAQRHRLCGERVTRRVADRRIRIEARRRRILLAQIDERASKTRLNLRILHHRMVILHAT
jgi:hypothetical protein